MDHLTNLLMAAAYDCKMRQVAEGLMPERSNKIIEDIDFLNKPAEYDQQYKEG
jgi:hypothetical protein